MITYIIIAITTIISFLAFSNHELVNKGVFNPFAIAKNKDFKRFITHGFLHADINHLLFNMLSLYFFGPYVEIEFQEKFGNLGSYIYVFFYLSAIVVSSIYSFFKNKENVNYNALGASGAISSIIFASIIFSPLSKIYLFFIPIGIPAYIFGPIYLIISGLLAKRGGGGIAHDAHFFGALYGIIFTIIAIPNSIKDFIQQIMNQ